MKSEVKFFPADYTPGHGLTYVIIGARYLDRWIFVYHNERSGYGFPAGHIDKNESALDAADRELREETGALKFSIECVAGYSVVSREKIGSGRLYYADVSLLGDIIDTAEIGNIMLSQVLPGNLIFPDIQMLMYRELSRYHNRKVRL